jgi:hypothetical protein
LSSQPLTRTIDVAIEQKYPVLLESAKASIERIKQRLRHLRALARVKRVLNDYTLASELDRQFGDLPVGLRKILLSMIHGFARTLAISFTYLEARSGMRSSRCPFGRSFGLIQLCGLLRETKVCTSGIWRSRRSSS